MDRIDYLAERRTPFIFIISFNKSEVIVEELSDLSGDILFDIEGFRNYSEMEIDREFQFSREPIPFREYKIAFDEVIEEIKRGNTYLLNLSFRSKIETELKLEEIFHISKAKYKIYLKGRFVCFSPEKFIEIRDNKISTYPMKGTIDAGICGAKDTILNNQKEMAEHIMIVDLMRNDLGIVGSDVKVRRFRYIDKIRAGDKELLQVSSEITAKLPKDWRANLGSILNRLLPAGSVTGTPKRSTVDIIDRVENYNRGFYTGIFGIFTGDALYSAVMIRFIEEESRKLFYKSGGGITIDSSLESEYQELIDKIYIPV